jgi:hypothetical protein
MSGFHDPPGFDAVGAYAHPLDIPVHQSANFLQIWIPAGFGLVVGMADIKADHWLFAAYFTYFRHRRISFYSFISPGPSKAENGPSNL